ncbi:MAG: hypothetical protein ACRBBP_08405 [Bdellovibrionales bacterium]
MGLFFYTLIGCDGFESLVLDEDQGPKAQRIENSPNETLRENPYQIGVEWNRRVLENVDVASRQVFQLYRSGMGAVGTGTYIGEIGGKHLVMTAAHTYKELSSCRNEVSFIAKSEKFDLYFYCSDWSFQLKDNDVLFFEIKSPDAGAFENLKPVAFSEKSLKAGDPLRMLTIERLMPDFNFNWFIDDSSDCVLLRENSRYLLDPDTGVQEKGDGSDRLASWSLPIGCDGKHGDSGAPVFDEEFGLTGILWTGKYPKTEASGDIKFLSTRSVWSNFNYMVPISKISSELERVIGNEFYLSLETRNVLKGLSAAIKNEESEYLGF